MLFSNSKNVVFVHFIFLSSKLHKLFSYWVRMLPNMNTCCMPTRRVFWSPSWPQNKSYCFHIGWECCSPWEHAMLMKFGWFQKFDHRFSLLHVLGICRKQKQIIYILSWIFLLQCTFSVVYHEVTMQFCFVFVVASTSMNKLFWKLNHIRVGGDWGVRSSHVTTKQSSFIDVYYSICTSVIKSKCWRKSNCIVEYMYMLYICNFLYIYDYH